MLFEISCTNGCKFVYDNLTQNIYENGERIFLDTKFPNLKYHQERKESANAAGKLKELAWVRLVLGRNCNLKCKYCLQGTLPQKDLPPLSLCDTFIDKIIKNDIKFTKYFGFWGGEPLMYWEHIKRLLPVLREMFPTLEINAVTNGTLLDREKIDFMAKYGMLLGISHDGPADFLKRDTDPLDDPMTRDAWKYALETLKGSSINCVFSPYNRDVQNIEPWFREKLGMDYVPVSCETSLKFTNSGANLDRENLFTEEQYNDLTQNLYELCVNPPEYKGFKGLTLVGNSIFKLAQKIVNNEHQPLDFRCAPMRANSISVWLDGTVTTCHNFGKEMDTIGSLDDLLHARTVKPIGWWQRPWCANCPYLSGCNAGCPCETQEEHALECRSAYAYWKAIFHGTWFNLFDTEIESIKPLTEAH